MAKQVQDAYIVAAKRAPVGKAPARHVPQRPPRRSAGACAEEPRWREVPSLDPKAIDDVIAGCAIPEAEQGMNVARVALLLAGLPDTVAGATVNRFCSSGLQAVSMAADRVRLGEADVMIAAGTESMSMIPMGGNKISFSEHIFDSDEDVAIGYGMGITAEKVAQQWKVSREAQDRFALGEPSQGGCGTQSGEFRDEIAPYTIDEKLPDLAADEIRHVDRTVAADEGPRADTSLEVLAKLRPAFAAKGSVTAGNSSQTSDGAGAVVVASEAALKRFNLQPLARFLGFAVAGVPPRDHGHRPEVRDPQSAQAGGTEAGRPRSGSS